MPGLNITSTCCMALSAVFGNKTSFPFSKIYQSSQASYFSVQAASAAPACIFSPESAQDVSEAIRILTAAPPNPRQRNQGPCLFAIRSGGHAASASAANIDGGVTMDLQQLNSIDVDESRRSVSLGVGNTWDAVYSRLDGLNLSVTGGRTAGVGVGGLSLGGGISFLGTRNGWTSDTIYNFEVVLANGSIINANNNENPDLHWALKGGGNNFGIVTRIDMEAFELGPFWGGYLYFPSTVWAQTSKQLVSINSNTDYDDFAALTLSWGYSATLGTAIASNLDYTKAVKNPTIFAGFSSLPTLLGQVGITNMTQASKDLASQQVTGERQFWATNTFASTQEIVNMTYLRFNESLPGFTSVDNIVLAYTLEPLPPALYARHAHHNPFGLGNRNQSLLIGLLTASWTDPKDDVQVETAAWNLLDSMEKDARDLNGYDPFLYLNYAAPRQDPIASYGVKNVARMRKVAEEVDPHGVFVRQVPGGFKIPQ
ncbi:putative oxidoreductase [Xylariaceae sp. FL0804]|nr:putative oxidoreductase [Xylariaceae sp. FL0804]